MGCLRAVVCIVLPPLAVVDKGCGALLVTAFLTLCGWVPGILSAVVFCTRADKR